MNHSMINASVSMNGLQQKLDILANNIANINTVGYKRKDASFQEILKSVKNQPEKFQLPGRMTPSGLQLGWGPGSPRLAQTSHRARLRIPKIPST
ncbi:flagellar basal body protein [Paenibacillus larvae]|nr:flagellar basal body protein [Paenibacillus larvae]MDT2259158.1 flagellar basal body protein [Paenibacillus larvae]MDT2263230.1 flagellar basal body protein [Paenibacillus larvae]MDT2293050.1 flagellar basal body protein [Paenibacillus larvae]